MNHFEANFDGLVGPSHNYGGLAHGNVASQSNRSSSSNPREGALQGLAKMLKMHQMGLKQGVFAPHARPDLATLRQLGFAGTDREILNKVSNKHPELLQAVYSASSMWVANAATVSPSVNTSDGRVHFTVANLASHLHRAIEPYTTFNILKATFDNSAYFAIHRELPFGVLMGDEGAANHTSFSHAYGQAGVEFFVYGQQSLNSHSPRPLNFPARQSLEASQAVARRHGLNEDRYVFAQQLPSTIDAGVFHNDVIAVGNLDTLFCHELAFYNQAQVIKELRERCEHELHVIEVPDKLVSLEAAVKTYLFNSQLLQLPDGKRVIVVPIECQENTKVWNYLNRIESDHPSIDQVIAVDIKQSMRNGGGPACLRLRVPLNDASLAAVNSHCLIDEASYAVLCDWVSRHYRDRVDANTLRDPQFMEENYAALDELTQILQLGSIYPFQME